MLRVCLLALVFSTFTAVVHAQAPLETVRARYAEGDFEGLLAEEERLEREGSLTRDELLDALELRALAQRAIGDEPGAERTLRALAWIAPDHALGREVPPVLRARFADLVEGAHAPELRARSSTADGAFRLEAEVPDDPEHVVRRIELRARAEGGDWQIIVDRTLVLSAAPGTRIEWEARAVGPASAGVATARGTTTMPGGTDDTLLWALVGSGIGLAVAGAVIAVVVVAIDPTVETVVEGPVLGALRF
ncbi:MAG: hypothetical protein J0L92_09090 [Deltaproteobacteria bacterium]|nr:hypothetical protein [Deltaproteobacteria bacterium]